MTSRRDHSDCGDAGKDARDHACRRILSVIVHCSAFVIGTLMDFRKPGFAAAWRSRWYRWVDSNHRPPEMRGPANPGRYIHAGLLAAVASPPGSMRPAFSKPPKPPVARIHR